ncbi:hypothetical protein N7453_006349 [Penicillium expansum]|nr:hypothetical protein N7453_006349 [Penicillium expansum]
MASVDDDSPHGQEPRTQSRPSGQIELTSPSRRSQHEELQGPRTQTKLDNEEQMKEKETLPLDSSAPTTDLDQQIPNSKLDLNEEAKDPKSPQKDSTSVWQDTWRLEFLAIFFSIACFIAICVLLKVYDQKTRPTLSYDISLNTIVSVLATACKSALVFSVGEAIGQLKWVWYQGVRTRPLLGMQLFDNASRGPLGSLKIIFSHCGKPLISFGAAIVVLMLAFDPFVQQVLSYPVRSAVLSPPAGIADAPQADNMTISTSTTALAGSTLLGIWSNGFDVQPTCSSGNCTWPTFPFGRGYNSSDESSYTNGTCEVLFPRGFGSKTSIGLTATEGVGYLLVEIPYLMAWKLYDSSTGSPGQTSTYANVTNPIVALQSPRRGVFVKNATECSLTTCLRYYDILVHDGNAVINITKIDYGKSAFPEDNENGTYSWTPETSQNSDFTGSTFMEYFFVESFDSYIPNVAYGLWAYWNSSTAQASYGTNGDWFSWADDSPSIPVLLRFQNVTFETIMSNVADSWTKLALQNSDHSVNGTAYSIEVFVNVKWLWLIFPGLMVLLCVINLSATVLISKRVRAPVWKSSALAYLYHGLTDLDEEDTYQTIGGMENSAERAHVQLRASHQNGRLALE